MKKNRGITLIALIITVILLLILVGVSVNVIIKGNLFSNAQKAVDGTNAKVNEQQTIMDELMNEWDEIEKDYCSHNWKNGEILLQPTCTTTGKKQMVCENCGNLLEVEIPALGHNYVNRVCTRCGEKEPGCTTHTYGDWVITKSPTCVAEGSKKRTCTVCGVEEVETIPATGVHTYGEWKVTKQATCTADGTKTEFTCDVTIPNTWKKFFKAELPVIELDDSTESITVSALIKAEFDATSGANGAWLVMDDVNLLLVE